MIFRAVLLALVCLSALPAFSVDSSPEARQLVIPKNIFVGDTVVIRYEFSSDVCPFPAEVAELSVVELSPDYSVFARLSGKCLVKSVEVSRTGSLYSLRAEIVPWKTGTIDFPAFDLGALMQFSTKSRSVPPVVWVDFEPLSVLSIAEHLGADSFRPPSAPLLVPGTKLILGLVLVAAIALFSAFVFSLTRIPAISAFFSRLVVSLSLKKNARIALRNFRRLLKNSDSLGDVEFAARVQSVSRNYLSGLLGEEFSSATTGDLPRVFSSVFGDDVPPEIEIFVSVFARTDYIRFAHGLCDSEFKADERRSMVSSLIKAVSADVGSGAARDDAGFEEVW